MLIGHYATALVANKHQPNAPLWLFLAAAMFLDFLMSVFVLTGLETMQPHNPEAPKFTAYTVDMTYSHDLLPVIVWAVIVGVVAYLITKSKAVSIWALALVLLHEVCDLVTGFYHHVYGEDSPRLGLGLYNNAPLEGLVVELVLSVICVWWFCKGSALSTLRKAGLYAIVIIACAMMLPLSV